MRAENGTAGLLGSLPVSGVEPIVRRTIYTAVAAGVVVAAVAALVGYPLVAPGVLVGLGLAVVNHRVFQSTALRFTSEEGQLARKPFAGSVLLRLGVCTAVAIVLLVWVRAMGFGVIAGLAVFQAAMLLNAIVALIGYQRRGMGIDQ